MIPVTVCVGTACYLRGSQDLLQKLLRRVAKAEGGERVDIRATFCSEGCDRGPTVRVHGHTLHHASLETVMELIGEAQAGTLAPVPETPCPCPAH